MEIGKILEQKQDFYRNNRSKALTNTSIELPEQINNLITGNDYWRKAKENRYKKLVREGYMQDLLQLAEVAESKRNPANWFAKAASKVEWERTLKFLAKIREVARNAAEVIQHIAVPANGMQVVYKACWKLNAGVVRHAVTAAEIGRDPYKLFTWLCWHA